MGAATCSNTPMDRDEIRAMRRSYGELGLSEGDANPNPITQFEIWLTAAAENPYVVEANAMVLGTIAGDQPKSRSVLLKEVSQTGFVFYSNYESDKGKEISQNQNVSLTFPWFPMERQVIVLGTATKVSNAESADYFATRPWSSQIGAWASNQSEVIAGRDSLQKSWDEIAAKYPEGSTVPLPPNWGGYCVVPHSIEFWQGRYSRLHDRLRYTFDPNKKWQLTRLAP